MNIICFHNPDEENGYLSNWYGCTFKVNGILFSSMGQFMMYKKAERFGDHLISHRILETDDVAEIKSLGRQVTGYDDHIWNGIRQIIVYEGLLAKFSQNELLRRRLKMTEQMIFAECAVKDQIWGIGLAMNDPRRYNINQWNGKNLLGYTLMMVRDKV